jgi:DNA-binding CsgD family transcriptional regulator
MAKLSDIYKLRQEMAKVQSQVKYLKGKGLTPEQIADKLDIPVKSVKVIIKWKCKDSRKEVADNE